MKREGPRSGGHGSKEQTCGQLRHGRHRESSSVSGRDPTVSAGGLGILTGGRLKLDRCQCFRFRGSRRAKAASTRGIPHGDTFDHGRETKVC